MKWNKEQEQQLRDLCFAEKSNKEIAAIMGIKLADVHSGRSRFGITVAKVSNLKNVQAAVAEQKIKRAKVEIQEEILKVEKALDEAGKKTDRCRNRLKVLKEELKAAK